MNIIKKIFLLFKNKFVKKNEVKKIQEPIITIKQDEKNSFIESLKINTNEKRNTTKIETLTCNGDGLGIQKKITY